MLNHEQFFKLKLVATINVLIKRKENSILWISCLYLAFHTYNLDHFHHSRKWSSNDGIPSLQAYWNQIVKKINDKFVEMNQSKTLWGTKCRTLFCKKTKWKFVNDIVKNKTTNTSLQRKSQWRIVKNIVRNKTKDFAKKKPHKENCQKNCARQITLFWQKKNEETWYLLCSNVHCIYLRVNHVIPWRLNISYVE